MSAISFIVCTAWFSSNKPCERVYESRLSISIAWKLFAAHPRIGGGPDTGAQSARGERWSELEQADAALEPRRDDALRAELSEGNRRYERRFGFTYVVCATGRSAAEMLALLRSRLGNEPALELGVAAAEQRRITRLRLERMLLG